MKHVVMFSGGLGSWMTAKRVVAEHGAASVTLLFADVGNDRSPHVGEDGDTYRFVNEAAANVGAELVTVSDGRDIWQVFHDRLGSPTTTAAGSASEQARLRWNSCCGSTPSGTPSTRTKSRSSATTYAKTSQSYATDPVEPRHHSHSPGSAKPLNGTLGCLTP